MNNLLLDIVAFVISKLRRRPFNWVRTDLVIRKWRKRGVTIGSNCYVNYDVVLDRGVVIGDGTTITGGSMVLTHDAVPATFLPELDRGSAYNRVCRRAGVKIGSQCFIGAKCIVLPGLTIGNRVIVAAGSVVTKDIPSGVVVAGNPAKTVASIEDYIAKQKARLADGKNQYR